MLESRATSEEVNNCVIFIVDSFRYDALDESVAARGAVAKTVTPSTFTATSLPSILTGRYPLSHRVWSFSDKLPKPPLLYRKFENTGWNADTIWRHIDNPTEKPPFKLLDLPSHCPLVDLSPPFLHVEHHRGGHIPYGDGNTAAVLNEFEGIEEFCKEFAGRQKSLRERYNRGINSAIERFFEMVDHLDERGLLKNTLLILTSDHGELLGEHGFYGHGAPMVPEVVTVPTVFMGAGISSGSIDQLLSSVDLVPTIFGATNRPKPRALPGCDLWNSKPVDDRVVFSQQWDRMSSLGYRAASAWRGESGRVKHYAYPIQRLLAPIRDIIQHPMRSLVRSHLPGSIPQLISTYGKSEILYGENPPSGTILPDSNEFDTGVQLETENKPTKDHLRELGYLE